MTVDGRPVENADDSGRPNPGYGVFRTILMPFRW